MFKNMKIGAKLGLGFGILLTTIAIVALLSISKLSGLNESINDISKDKFTKVVHVAEMVDLANENRSKMRNLLLNSDSAQNQKDMDQIVENGKKIDDIVVKLQESIKSDEGKALLKEVIDAQDAYRASGAKVKTLALQGNKAEAYALLVNETRAVQKRFMNSTDALKGYQIRLVNEASKQADADYASAKTMMTILTVIAAIAGIMMAMFITRSITAPMAEALDAANKIAAGDMSIKIVADTNEETGQLKAAMLSMLNTIIAARTELNGLVEEVKAGNLTERADASKFQGDWKGIIDGANEMLNIIYAAAITDGVGALVKLSNGDFKTRITTEYKGDYDVFKKAVNDVAYRTR